MYVCSPCNSGNEYKIYRPMSSLDLERLSNGITHIIRGNTHWGSSGVHYEGRMMYEDGDLNHIQRRRFELAQLEMTCHDLGGRMY